MRNENPEYVAFGDVARNQLGMQCQYASRYLTGVGGKQTFGDDLRWHGGDLDTLWQQLDGSGNYHALRIHADDVAEFVLRVKRYQHAAGIRSWSELDQPAG